MGNPAEETTITRTLDSIWKWRMVSRPAVAYRGFEASPVQFMDWEAAAVHRSNSFGPFIVNSCAHDLETMDADRAGRHPRRLFAIFEQK